MACWLTVRHPPEVGAPSYDRVSGIWVPHQRAGAFRDVAVGNGVSVYQTKHRPPRWPKLSDGTRGRSRYLPGRGGITAVGRVSEVHSVPPITKAALDDRIEIDWTRIATVQFTMASSRSRRRTRCWDTTERTHAWPRCSKRDHSCRLRRHRQALQCLHPEGGHASGRGRRSGRGPRQPSAAGSTASGSPGTEV